MGETINFYYSCNHLVILWIRVEENIVCFFEKIGCFFSVQGTGSVLCAVLKLIAKNSIQHIV